MDFKEASEHPGTEWAVLGPTTQGVRKCADDLKAGLYAIAPSGLVTKYNRSPDTMGLYLKNGSIIHLVSADKPDRLRGYNLAGAWCDEIASWRYPDTWAMGLMPAMRDPDTKPHVVVTSTPKPLSLLNDLIKDEDVVDPTTGRRRVVVIRGGTYENFKNLAPEFIADMKSKYEGTRIGRQEIYGELLTDVEGALVSQEMIEATRYWEMPSIQMMRIVVGVDPAMTTGERSDETGIVVCAKGADGRGYVLEDLSCKKSPDGWAKVVCEAYEKWGADRVVAENNIGKDMVEMTVRSVNPNISYKGVHAKVGKRLRAKPIAALYEQKKVSHVGDPDGFGPLEAQWTSWVPDAPGDSPDRVDALVHALTELGLVGQSDAHVASWLELDHPSCFKCGTHAPKGTPKCPKCGADRPVVNEPVSQAQPESEAEKWSLTSGRDKYLAPDPTTTKAMEMLKQLNQPTQWWRN